MKALPRDISAPRLTEEASVRLNAIVNLSDDAIISKTLDGIITSWNPGATKLFGYSAEEAVGKPMLMLFPPERFSEEKGILDRIGHGERVEHFETVRVRKDGKHIDVSVALSPLADKAGKIIGASKIARDITQRKRAEQALHKERDFISAVLNTVGALVVVLDRQARIVRFNRACEQLTGYSFAEANGRDVMELLVLPEERAAARAEFGSLSAGMFPNTFENHWVTRDGVSHLIAWSNTALLDSHGGVEHVVATGINITERKRAENALGESERKFRTLFDVANDAIYMLYEGLFVDCNAKGLELLGLPRDQIIGRSPTAFSPAVQPDGRNSAEKAAELIGSALAGTPQFFEWLLCLPDGTAVYADISVNHLQLGEKVYLQAIVRDTTERKRAEQKAQRLTRQMQLLLESAGEGIYGIDTEGLCTFINRAAAKILGCSPGQALGRNMHDLLHHHHKDGSDYSIEECPIFHAFQRNEQCRVDSEVFWRADGTPFPVEYSSYPIVENGSVTGAVVTFTDITERKLAEEQIAEQAAFLDKARDAILVRDLEGKILFWNQGAERVYGWTRKEVLGRNVAAVLYAHPHVFEKAQSEAISKGEWHGELQHLTRDRREITTEGRWTLIRDHEGQPKSVLAINTDITEKKKIEAQFMRAQRMESLGTLAGGVAHDLNNILAPIMLSIGMLEEVSNDPQAKEILETIAVSAKRGADIVRQVLSFARGLEGERIEVHPRHLLKDLKNIIKDTFPKDIRLQFSIPNDTWAVLGDPTQLQQIFLNLCVNARDAMPHGGSLTINAENCVLDEQYAAMNLQTKAGQYVKINVTDSGTGIPPHLLEKIFEPFFTTKEVNKGTGLGLSTVMAIVKSHGGLINVYSELGKGTTFKVYLPAMTGASEAATQPEQENLPRGNGETVLVVDDEASILTITTQTLQAFGYRVLTAVNGAAAVANYAEHKNEIAAVLTDMMMPVMDGSATIHALRQINPAVKIIAASGLGENGIASKASAVGVKHFLTKPCTAGTLLKTIRSILHET